MNDAIQVKMWSPTIETETQADGSILVRQAGALAEHPEKMTARLVQYARTTPDSVWLAERGEDGAWKNITYAQALDAAHRLGQALLGLGLSADRPVMILSGNDIEHALLAIAAQFVGIPSAAISTAYSLISTDFGKLKDIAEQITPGLVYATNYDQFENAIQNAIAPNTPILVKTNPSGNDGVLMFDALMQTEPTADVEDAYNAVTAETVAKFLFTSGTTGSPKAVIQTHGMIATNQEMVVDCYAYMRNEPPVVVDWAPWSHTASGNKVFYMVLNNGGTFYMDAGKPTPKLMQESIKNLNDVSPTWYFNVPAGYEMLIEAMEADDELRANFFRNLKMMIYAGAGMAQHTWDRLLKMAEDTLGHSVLLATGLGSTETAPFALFCTEPQAAPGNIGVPAKGITLKLVPVDDKLEARLKGPNITPGYWRNPKLTAEAFDEDGYYCLGDAVRFADPSHPGKGFYFDGRIAENFKLGTGTWVAVGSVRAKLVDQMQGLIRDAVLAGPDREYLGALLIPFIPALRALVSDANDLTDADILQHPVVVAKLKERLSVHAKAATGSSNRVSHALVFTGELSLDLGEVTDKGSINQRAVLRHRAELIDQIYSDTPELIHADWKS